MNWFFHLERDVLGPSLFIFGGGLFICPKIRMVYVQLNFWAHTLTWGFDWEPRHEH